MESSRLFAPLKSFFTPGRPDISQVVFFVTLCYHAGVCVRLFGRLFVPAIPCFRDPALGDIMSVLSVDSYGAVRCLLLLLLSSLTVQIVFRVKKI